MAKTYEVNYIINVNADTAKTAINNFKQSIASLQNASRPLAEIQRLTRSINDSLAGFRSRRITIDTSVAQDGTKDKSKITDPKLGVKYEKYGHLSDALDYAICLLLSKEWRKFQSAGSEGIATVNKPIYGTFEY